MGAGGPATGPADDAEPLPGEAPLPDDDGTSGEGAWIELVGRGRPRGRRGRQRDPRPVRARWHERRAGLRARRGRAGRDRRSDPAGHRPRVPARPRRRGPPGRRSPARATALGHLQAFGLRPIGDLPTRVVHEADWAQAWKAFFPVLHIGRRVVIRPTWRRHRRRRRRGRPRPRSGDGLRDRPPPDDPALPRGSRAPGGRRPPGPGLEPRRLGPGARRRHRLGDPGHRRRAVRRGRARRRRHRPDRGRRIARQRPPQSTRPPPHGPDGQPAVGLGPRSTSSSPTSSRRCSSRWRRAAARRAPTGRHARSRRASSSTASRRSAAAFDGVDLRVVDRSSEGDWVALTARRAERLRPALAPVPAAAATIGRDVPLPDPPGRPHRARDQRLPAVGPPAVRVADRVATGSRARPGG